jgi:hypothetical protein
VNTKHILNEHGKCIGSFAHIYLEAYYKISKVEIYLTTKWMICFTHTHECYDILDEWYNEGIIFNTRDTKAFPTINSIGTYVYSTQLVSRIYGENSSSHPKMTSTPIIYEKMKMEEFSIGKSFHLIL